MAGDVSRHHGVHRRVDRLEALHDVERSEETASGRVARGDSEEDDRAGNVDASEADHAEDGLLRLGDDPAGRVSPIKIHLSMRDEIYATAK